jgi:hypothetical protein
VSAFASAARLVASAFEGRAQPHRSDTVLPGHCVAPAVGSHALAAANAAWKAASVAATASRLAAQGSLAEGLEQLASITVPRAQTHSISRRKSMRSE